ncbi:hypothetical protein GIB67_037277 [Kingdonia uniflora]|uniref:Uncharacterized protein n=1 Tax=Kingdonia uniflora TaxID=39325 RepID=A0A7J7MS74_9MAGN|nr:hypothetical protein GIB67_037277 [Kingdonia uniflora]
MQYWFYEYCGVGHPIVKEDAKYSTYLRLRAWERGNRRKTNDHATNMFILGRYHIDHRTVDTITWEPWLEFAVSKIEDVLTTKLLFRKRMSLQVPNGNCKYYLGDRCYRQLADEARILLDPPLSMSSYISPATLQEMRQAGFLDSSVHSLSQDFSLPGEAEGPDPGWHMEWTGQREMLPIARLRDLPTMFSFYGAEERLQELTDKNDTLRRHLDSVDEQLYAHDLQLRWGRDVRVMQLPPGGGARMRQRGSGPRTRGGGISRRGRGTGDDSE